MNVLSLLKNIKLFVFDVDGVLTDSSLILLESGEMVRTMNIKDGYALQLAVKKGYTILIISGGSSTAVKSRLQKLGIQHIFLGITDKAAALSLFLAENKFSKENVLYMGDDMPDLEPMLAVGMAAAPFDAVPQIKAIAQYISPKSGGHGCVRDVVEKVLMLNGDWTETENTPSI
jgi:3-deoxy-D-manno-octulosonate 8-phosphate phosphatase (KDO 8-P phosphatase)